MKLYLLRHAKAVNRGTAKWPHDRSRPLVPEGRQRMRRGARAMRQMGLSFDLILSSPWVRARQTAEIAADVLRLRKRIVFSDALTGDSDPRRILAELRAEHRALDSVLLVGHEPHLSGVMSLLLVGQDTLSTRFRKGGLCKLMVDWSATGHAARLEWLLTPRQLNMIADD